ncbi:MAG: ExeM/NucH family extracellular endonuclease [Micrococcales bacterium]|nr:ExeM/NucH family extracellular endonuclease [Micrococcales bacterium]
MSVLSARRCAGIAIPALVLGSALLASPAQAASTSVVISEAYGGGGNSGATYTHDFVELFNRSGAAVDVTGWKLSYYSAAGNLGNSCTLSGSIAASGHYLVQQAKGTAGTTALPTPDATCAAAMSATAGSVEIRDAGGAVVDLLGYGTATKVETAAAPATAAATSSARKDPRVDTDDNSADFATGSPTPQNSGAPTTPTDPTDPPAPATRTIAEIQGTGASTPLAGQSVTTTGVVTAAYPTGGFSGFYIQTPGTGGSTDTTPGSDGIFVYSGTTPVTVAEGDCLTVTGTATEYGTLTQLSKPTVTPATGCAPVTPTVLTGLPTEAEREALEGMLVQPTGTYTITNNYQLNQYGQVGLAIGDKPLYQATDVVRPGAEAAAYEAANLAKYITLDDGSSWDYIKNESAQNSELPYLSHAEPMRTDSQVTFTRPVILDYRFQWNYQPTGQIVGATDAQDPLATENDREALPPNVGGNLRLGSFNVLNYFTELGEDEDEFKNCPYYADRDGTPVTTNYCEVRGAWTHAAFEDQKAKLIAAVNRMGSAVVALSEIEASSSVTWVNRDRDYTLRKFVAELNANGGNWAYAESPVVTPGSEDVIRVAFIYNPTLVRPVDDSTMLLDEAFANARYPLGQRWQAPKSNTQFVTVVNHFKSKGSGEDDGTGQGLSNPSREAQARAVTAWTKEIWPAKPVFLMGDFNAYSKETPVQIIEGAGFTNVIKANEPSSASYQFSGRLGSLDHIFANSAAKALVTGGGIWDINADESVAMQYSRRNYNVTDFYRPDQFASSDHDPAVAGIQVSVPSKK